MKVKSILALFMCLMLCSCASIVSAEPTRYELSFFDVFDTYSTVIFYAQSKAQADAWGKLAHDELLQYHQLYDIYHAYEGITNLHTVNRMAALAPVKVNSKLFELLAFSKEMNVLTQQRVNIAMGSVLNLWHAAREYSLDQPEEATLPDMQELKEAALHTDINDLVLDEATQTVFFADPLLKLDVGAIAKGYATERVAQTLISQGVTSALLSIGGNVRAIGTRGDGTAFRVAIQNPDPTAADANLETRNLMDCSLVTSGDYQRFYTFDGKNYHHIIDPDTLMPSEYMSSISIITKDGGLADALSTALFLLPQEKGQALIKTLADVKAVWVLKNGEILRSEE